MSSSVQAAHSSNPHQFHTIHPHHYNKYQELTKLTPGTNSDDHAMNVQSLRKPPSFAARQVTPDSGITTSHEEKPDEINNSKNVDEKRISNHLLSRPTSLCEDASVITKESCDHDLVTTVTSSSDNAAQSSSSTKIQATGVPVSRINGENHTDDAVNQTESVTTIPSSQTCTTKKIPVVVGSCTGNTETTQPIVTSPPTASPPTITTEKTAGMKRKISLNVNEGISPTLGSSRSNTPMSRRDSLPLGLRNKKMKATDCLLFAATLLEQDVAQALVAASTTPTADKGVSSLFNENVPVENNATLPFVPATIASSPSKKSKSLKKMVFEKVERSLQEVALQKEQERKEQELQKEQERQDDNGSENNPKDADVLCGRGGKVNKHPGNIVYRKVVEYNKSYYQSVHKKHRILVSQSIVKAILNYGGRFMGQKGKEWTPICFKRAVQKTSQALRERSNTSEVALQEVVGDCSDEKKQFVVETTEMISGKACTKGDRIKA